MLLPLFTPLVYTAYSAAQEAAPAWLPTDLFSGWTEDGTDITLPIASLPTLTAALADGATGDARAVAYALVDRMLAWYIGLTTPPEAMSAVLREYRAQTTGDYEGTVKKRYEFTFYVNYSESGQVTDEAS